MNKALFLDRDGTINVEKNYLYKTEDFEFNPGIIELCQRAQELGYLIIVITNQSGVERGFYTENDMNKCNQYMLELFRQANIKITAVYTCISANNSHPDRKPNPGMFIKAQKEHNIDMKNSISIGDKPRDIEAAEKAGVGKNYLINSYKEFGGIL